MNTHKDKAGEIARDLQGGVVMPSAKPKILPEKVEVVSRLSEEEKSDSNRFDGIAIAKLAATVHELRESHNKLLDYLAHLSQKESKG